jgi:hypothetical protein
MCCVPGTQPEPCRQRSSVVRRCPRRPGDRRDTRVVARNPRSSNVTPRQLDTRTEDRDRAEDRNDDPDTRSRIILHDRSSPLRPHDLTETHFSPPHGGGEDDASGSYPGHARLPLPCSCDGLKGHVDRVDASVRKRCYESPGDALRVSLTRRRCNPGAIRIVRAWDGSHPPHARERSDVIRE